MVACSDNVISEKTEVLTELRQNHTFLNAYNKARLFYSYRIRSASWQQVKIGVLILLQTTIN